MNRTGPVTALFDLYLCPRCYMPFAVEDKSLISRRDGLCAECTKAVLLEKIGLPTDFLTRRLGPT